MTTSRLRTLSAAIDIATTRYEAATDPQERADWRTVLAGLEVAIGVVLDDEDGDATEVAG